jgi:hypothetical protein
VNGKKPVHATRNKITKKLKRGPKNRSTQKVLKIGIVQVIERLVHIKEKEVNQENLHTSFLLPNAWMNLKHWMVLHLMLKPLSWRPSKFLTTVKSFSTLLMIKMAPP